MSVSRRLEPEDPSSNMLQKSVIEDCMEGQVGEAWDSCVCQQ